MLVLLVDDDARDAELIRRALEREHMEVVWAGGFHDGLAALDRSSVHAILVEHDLAERTGLDFLAHARRRRPSVPVIVVTNTDSREIDDAALETGAAGFLLKRDARSDLLARTIRYAVRRTSEAARTSSELPKTGGKDLTLQVALARGMTIRDAAIAAGMSERTAYRRMNDPVFAAQLEELRTELRERMLDRTAQELKRATEG